eukprot:s380_g17.t1
MYKLRAELQRQGLVPTSDELGRESSMAHNVTLNYGGITPAMAVFGVLPRGFYNPETPGILSYEGTSEVEFYREVKDDIGWRGPALLLRLDADEGVAVIQYQGKPYLVALRHIRPFRGIYHVSVQQPEVDEMLYRVMRYVESLTDYKIYLYGWVRDRKNQWVQTPKNNEEVNRIMQRAVTISTAITKRQLHGCILGKALRSFKPPFNTTGILITWIHGGRSYAVQEHKSDRHLKLKKITMHPREETCIFYMFYYNTQLAEEEGTLPRKPVSDTSSSTAMQPSLVSDGTASMDAENVSKKRDGPESRSVVLAPERKKQKIEFVRKDYEFIRNYYCHPWSTTWFSLTSKSTGTMVLTA